MNLQGLSFESMPPLAVPYRFFITAPVFIMVVGLLWLFASPIELISRWSNLMLATTHAITLGFMLMVMFGALFQILPVVSGIAIPKVRVLSMWVYISLLLGVALLVSGFALGHHYLLASGALSSLLAFLIFLAGLLTAFPQMRNTPTSWSIRLAAFGLLVTIGFGVAFIAGWLVPGWFPDLRGWTNVHLLWGITGWTLLLIMGVSFQIIPMFYVTPDYPKWVSQLLPALIILQLITYTLGKLTDLIATDSLMRQMQLVLLTITTSSYAVYTLYLLAKRKRRAVDVTVWFWKIAMVSFILAALLMLVIIFYQGEYLPQLQLLLIVITLAGFALALITGMLLKIIPFLVWLNIQQKWIKHPSRKMPLSNMQQVIPIKAAKQQYYLFIVILLVLIIIFAGYNPAWLIKIAAIQLIVTFAYLFYNLFKAKSLYNQLDKELDESQDFIYE